MSSNSITLSNRPSPPLRPAVDSTSAKSNPSDQAPSASEPPSNAAGASAAHRAAAQSQTTTFTTAKKPVSAGSVAAEKEAVKNQPLSVGSNGRRVALMQLFLVRKGYMTDAQFKANPGVFGETTAEAVRRFQNAHHLEPNGVVGPETRAAILRDMDDTTSRAPSLAPAPRVGTPLR
jgi:peptidoglycan hydrolase-like protein with peptidoglycan-binding domain